MTCDGARQLFSRHVDDRLAPPERGALASHLAACAACRAERARWGAVANALRSSGPTAIPAGLAARSWAAAVRSPPPSTLAAWFVSAARPAALAGVLAALLVWTLALVADQPRGAADATADPLELAVHLWTGEVGGDAP